MQVGSAGRGYLDRELAWSVDRVERKRQEARRREDEVFPFKLPSQIQMAVLSSNNYESYRFGCNDLDVLH